MSSNTVAHDLPGGNLGGIAEAPIAGGRPADEPAVAVQEGTTPRQRTVVATLATLADRCRDARIANPAVAVIGPVAALASAVPAGGSPTRPRRRLIDHRSARQEPASPSGPRRTP